MDLYRLNTAMTCYSSFTSIYIPFLSIKYTETVCPGTAIV